jgi:hypothetical protein
MYLATFLLYVFDHIKGIDDSRTKKNAMNPFKLYGTTRIIDDLNDIAVLVKQTQYTSIDEVFQAYDQAIISGYETL